MITKQGFGVSIGIGWPNDAKSAGKKLDLLSFLHTQNRIQWPYGYFLKNLQFFDVVVNTILAGEKR